MVNKLKSKLVLPCIVVLLCAMLGALAWLMGNDRVFAVGQESFTPAPEETAEVTEPPVPVDAALLLTERDERHATRVAASSVAPVTRTVAVGLDAANPTQTASCIYVPVYVDGVFAGYGYALNDTVYVSIPDYCGMIGFDCETAPREDGTVQYTVDGAEISIGYRDTIFYANGRTLYIPEGVPALDGQIVLPLSWLQQLFGATATYDAALAAVSVDTAARGLLENGESYYAKYDIYWLSRIIYAEANGQPFEGMVGVGNVVLTRVNYARFPATVEAGVFQSGQFTPVSLGAPSSEPSSDAVRAAKLAIEGMNTVGNSLYFINPSACDGGWFESSLSRIATIGQHVFYA